MMLSLTYVSQATAVFDDARLTALLHAAQKRNEARNITGALAHSNGWFVQVLEGESEEVSRLYGVIAKDPRHINPTIILKQTVAARAFADWSMAMIKCKQSANDTLRNVHQITRKAKESENFSSVDAVQAFIAPPRLAIQGDYQAVFLRQ